jgi:hypothetical protein
MQLTATIERAPDQRTAERHPTKVGAAARPRGAVPQPVVVTDISCSGCQIELQAFASVGTQVWLRLPDLESWFAQVVWSQHGRAGLKFEKRLHSAVLNRLIRTSCARAKGPSR